MRIKMKMNRNIRIFPILLLALIPIAHAQSSTVIFRESGFPSADSAPAPEALLQHVFSNAQFASTPELKDRLNSAKLLVLPSRPPFPQTPSPALYSFLHPG